ncbi:hypothetical protein ACFX14_044513 [Malus domestica]
MPTEEGRLLAKLASESRWRRKWPSGVAGGGRGLNDSLARPRLLPLIFLSLSSLSNFGLRLPLLRVVVGTSERFCIQKEKWSRSPDHVI